MSQAEIPRRYSSARERALAETEVPQWTNLSTNRIQLPPPSGCALAWRAVIGLTRVITALLILPTLFAFATLAGGVAGSLMAFEFVLALIFCSLALYAWVLLAGLLRWTIHA